MGKTKIDEDGNVLEPGFYEYQYTTYPKDKGYLYAYINDEVKIFMDASNDGNSKGKVFEFKEGDVISICNVNLLVFYKVKK